MTLVTKVIVVIVVKVSGKNLSGDNLDRRGNVDNTDSSNNSDGSDNCNHIEGITLYLYQTNIFTWKLETEHVYRFERKKIKHY